MSISHHKKSLISYSALSATGSMCITLLAILNSPVMAAPAETPSAPATAIEHAAIPSEPPAAAPATVEQATGAEAPAPETAIQHAALSTPAGLSAIPDEVKESTTETQTAAADTTTAQPSLPLPSPQATATPIISPMVVPQDLRPPSVSLGDLFVAIHRAKIYTDPKSASDATPDQSPDSLVALWKQEKDKPGFDLKTFVTKHFTMPVLRTASYSRKPDENVRDYISGMWDVLTRKADQPVAWSSLLSLPNDYIVPGGRFSECYYWDTYFTMIGLYEDQHIDLMRNMVKNIASLIDRYGFMPNGNRTYYMGRSQPPFFSVMLDLLASHDGQITYTTFLPALRREYDYWTKGMADLKPGSASHHVVKLDDGSIMFRPWDDMDTPRDESYIQDIETAEKTKRDKADLWRNLRAGAETGWDYSSRWLADGKTLSTIQATSLVIIEYNCLMVHLEQTLAHAYALKNNKEEEAFFTRQAVELTNAINTYLWNAQKGAYFDYNWQTKKQSDILSVATTVPLFFHLASQKQADAVAETIEKHLLKKGGLTQTDRETGQQWDYPNGWAPNEWMSIKGLEQYGHSKLAEEIARRWMERVIGTYEKSGVLLEKYDVVSEQINPKGGAGGGEYPMQIGFGWTNGTLLGLMNRYPQKMRNILDKNPLADQPDQQPLPPVDAWNAKGPEISITEKSPVKGMPLSALHTEPSPQVVNPPPPQERVNSKDPSP